MSGARRWRDLVPRVVSALVMAPLGLAAIAAGGVVWQVTLSGLAAICLVEWVAVCGVSPFSRTAVAAMCGLAGTWAYFVAEQRAPFFPLGIVAMILAANNAAVAVGLAYIGFGYASLLELRAAPDGLAAVVFVMLVVWANDTGAYAVGRTVGGPRLAPALSPAKTWAGALGGLAAGAVTAIAAAAMLRPAHPALLGAASAGLLLAAAGQAGDLLESALKRHFGRETSGSLIPGHGGLLDRLDSLIAAACAALFLRLVMHGNLHGVLFWP